MARGVSDGSWGQLVRWTDPDGGRQELIIPWEELAGEALEVRRELLKRGFWLASDRNARSDFIEHLVLSRPDRRVEVVPHTGWHEIDGAPCFVFRDGTCSGADPHKAYLMRALKTSTSLQRGTLESWQQGVAARCAGNSRLILAVCTALAGPCLSVLAQPFVAFNLNGPSSIGKSTALRVAQSCWSSPAAVKTWNATVSGLEDLAVESNDSFIAFDELSLADPNSVGTAVFTIANGVGKIRSTKFGGTRSVQSWRVAVLSSGEQSLSDKISEGRGARPRAGHGVRIIEVVADASAGLGLFEALHDSASASDLAKALAEATHENYGAAAPAIIEAVAKDVSAFRASAKAWMAEFEEAELDDRVSEQIRRIAHSFAVVSAVGEFAISCGILPWPPGHARWGIGQCFRSYLEERGTVVSGEQVEVRRRIKTLIQRFGSARFTLLIRDGETAGAPDTVRDRAGFFRDQDGRREYLIFDEVWREEIIKDLPHPRKLHQALIEEGLLVRAPDGKTPHSVKLPGIGQSRVYVVPAEHLDAQT